LSPAFVYLYRQDIDELALKSDINLENFGGTSLTSQKDLP
jgi:hypothetical protein